MQEERKIQIMHELVTHGASKVVDLSQKLHVSVDTVRRDLKALEQEGVAKYVHGGAVLTANESVGSMYGAFKEREVKEQERKRSLCLLAMEEIENGDVIFINAGTTGTILAEEIAKSGLCVTIITNNIQVANAFVYAENTSIDVHLLGGQLDTKEKCLYGYQCEKELESYLPDIAFLSINAVDIENGFTDFRIHEMGIMNIMQKKAKRLVAIMDSTKFGKQSNKVLFQLNQVDALYTDNGVSDNDYSLYIEKGICIHRATI